MKSKRISSRLIFLLVGLLWASGSYSQSGQDVDSTWAKLIWLRPYFGLGLGKEYGVSPSLGFSFWYWRNKFHPTDKFPKYHPFVTLEANPTPLWVSFSGGIGYGSERVAIETVVTRFGALDETVYNTLNPKLRLGYKHFILRFGPSFTLGPEKPLFGNFIQLGKVDLSIQLLWTPGTMQ